MIFGSYYATFAYAPMPAGSLSAVRMGPRAFLRHPRTCKGPYRGRFRSDKHAAVLRLQRTQPKDRRAYNAPYRNPCRPERHRADKERTGKAEKRSGKR